jgi:hypothetical protein
VSITTSKTRSAATFTVVFSQPSNFAGYVYCSAVPSGTVVTSTDRVVTTGSKTYYLAGSTAVTVQVAGLTAQTTYDGYCAAVTINGDTSGLQDVLDTVAPVTTDCCKVLSFTSAPAHVYGSLSQYSSAQSAQYTFTYALSAAPGATVTVSPIVYNRYGAVSTDLTPIPASMTFASTAVNLAGQFVLSGSALLSGDYRVVLAPSGSSALQYWNISTPVSVLNSASVKPTPVLTYAKLSDAGNGITMTFDSATNKAEIAASSFTCTQLFDFAGAGSSTCSWTSASTVRASFGSTASGLIAYPSPSDYVKLQGGLIKAACAAGVDCSFYVAAAQVYVEIAAPDNAVAPTVVLRAPSVIAACDDVVIDPSLTSGSGGRSWAAVSWGVVKQVSGGVEDASDIVSYLTSYGPTTSVPYRIPKAMLGKAIYTVTLTVTNFLQKSAGATTIFSIDDNPNLPIVSILGSPVLTMLRSDALSLYTSTTQASCAESSAAVGYSWIVSKDGINQNINSVSASANKFKLNAYTLAVRSIYTVTFRATVNATANYPAISAAGSVSVRVVDGAVFAVVAGGYNRNFATSSPITLYATPSYDQNVGTTGVSALTFKWSCTLLSAARLGEVCDNSVLVGSVRTASTLTFNSTLLDPTLLYGMQVTVAAADGRSASAVVSVKNSGGSTSTLITSTVMKVNYNSKLTLTGMVQGTYALDCLWSATQDALPMVFKASTPLTSAFSRNDVVNGFAYPLSVPANTLSPGSTLTFRLTAHYAGNATLYSSFSEMIVVVNAAPSGGYIASDPTTGDALSTVFLVTSADWADDPSDFPLSFEYAYRTMSTQPALTVQSRTTSNTVSTTLPAGLASQGYAITLVCVVYDAFLASTASTAAVTVQTSAAVDVSAYVSSQIAASLSTGNSDLMSQAIANAATSVNTVNCSAASNAYCASLMREPCFATPQTCSACLSGYTGISGDSNVRCRDLVAENVVLGAVGDACVIADDCLLNTCEGNVCVAPRKTCPSVTTDVCSGHGACDALDTSGKAIDGDCLVTDTACTAQCTCDDGYGGASCSLSAAELAGRDNTRAKLCETIVTVGNSADVSSQLLDSLVSSLYVSYDPHEVVSDNAQQVCQEALAFVADLAARGYLTSDTTTEVMFNSLSKYIKAPTTDAARRRRRLQGSSGDASSGDSIDSAVSQLSQGVLSALSNGEEPVSYVTDNLQIVISKSVASASSALSAPLTDTAATYGSGATSGIELPADANALLDNGEGYVEISVAQWGVNPFQNSSGLEGNLLRVQTSPLADARRRLQTADAEPVFYVVLQYFRAQEFNLSVDLQDALLNGVSSNVTYPVCTMHDGTGYRPCDGCTISTYTNHNVTFACPVSLLLSAGTAGGVSRRLARSLQGTDDGTDTGTDTGSQQVQFGTVFKELAAEFVDTLSFNPFKIDIEKAKGVLAFLCTLTFIIIVGYVYFHRWDCLDHSYLIYAKPEVDRKRFNEKYEASVEKFLKNGGVPAELPGDSASDDSIGTPKRSMSRRFSLFRILSPGKKGSTRLQLVELGSHRHSGKDSNNSTPNGSGKRQKSPRSPEEKHKRKSRRSLSQSQQRQMQYEALFERSNDESKSHRELFVSTIVADFLDSVMPKESLLKKSPRPIMDMVETIMKYHEYTAMFFEPSLQYTRSMRWTNIVFGTLIALFVSTLFFDIFYPDKGLCEIYTDEVSCIAEPSKVTDATLCIWTADPTQPNDGSCSLTPPPQDFIFVVILVLVTMTISLPVNGFYDYLLFFHCVRRPNLEQWGMNTEYWMGRATQEITGSDENPETPIQMLYRNGAGSEEARNQAPKEDSRQWADRENNRRLKRTQDDHNYIARHNYDNLIPAEAEVDQMMTEVKSFLDVFATLSEIPWQTSKVSAMRQARSNAIQRFLGVTPDGRPVPLSLSDYLWYGTPRSKLVATINSARSGAKAIEANLKMLGEGEMQNRDTMLLQYFILEQFTLFKQFILMRHMFVFSLSSPLPIDPLVWLVSWLIVIFSLVFFLYWAFAWGVSQGGKTFDGWLVNLSFSILQDVFAVQVFRVYIIYVVSMVSIKPQLKYIYRVLNRVAVSYAQDELEDNLDEIRVVQHISPACRAARLKITYKQATANLLRNINDTDVDQCQLRYELSMSTMVMIVLALPILAGAVSEAAGDSTLKSLIPPAISAILVLNYQFYIALGLLILIPYLSLVFIVLYLIRIRARHKELEAERLAAERNAVQHAGVKKWNAAARSKLNTRSYPALLFSVVRMFVGHYWTRPLDYLQWTLYEALGLVDNDTDKPQAWSMMNLPYEMQATVHTRAVDSVVMIVNRSRSMKGIEIETAMTETKSAKSSRLGTDLTNSSSISTIPPEVLSLRANPHVNWLHIWKRHRFAENLVAKPVMGDGDSAEYLPKGYVIGMLNKRLMHAHITPEFVTLGESLNQLPDLRPSFRLRDYEVQEPEEAEGNVSDASLIDLERNPEEVLVRNGNNVSVRAQKFRDRYTILYAADDALERLLGDYRDQVRAGKVQMIDEDERAALLYKPARTCNALVGYKELSAALAAMWDLFEPAHVPLSGDEREEVRLSFATWIVKHGQSFQHLHYHKHLSEVRAATLSRIESRRDLTNPVLALTESTEPAVVEIAHFSVRFQQFRAWFKRTCDAIVQYHALNNIERARKPQIRKDVM